MTRPAPTLRRSVSLVLKVAFVLCVMVFLGHRGLLSVEATFSAFKHPGVLLPPILLLFLMSLLGAVRWHWLLQAQGMKLPFPRTLQLTLVGSFFNIALPGAVSGDVVKAVYLGRDFPGRRAHAMGAILFDRICGLSALVLIAAGTALVNYSQLAHAPIFIAIRTALLVSGLGVLGFFGYLILVRKDRDPLLRLLRAIGAKRRRLTVLLRIYEGVRHYHHSRRTLLAALALSVFIHLNVCWTFLRFSAALGSASLPIGPLLLVVPFGLLVTAIPVLPAGIGTGHAAFGWGFFMMGSERGADVFTLFLFAQLLIGLLGGATYLRFRSRGLPPADQAALRP